MIRVRDSPPHDFIDSLLTFREDATLFRDSIIAYLAIGLAFKDIPVVMTSSAETGLSPPTFEEFLLN